MRIMVITHEGLVNAYLWRFVHGQDVGFGYLWLPETVDGGKGFGQLEKRLFSILRQKNHPADSATQKAREIMSQVSVAAWGGTYDTRENKEPLDLSLIRFGLKYPQDNPVVTTVWDAARILQQHNPQISGVYY